MNRREKLIYVFCMLQKADPPITNLEELYKSISYYLQLMDETPEITNQDRKLFGEITALSLIVLQKQSADEGDPQLMTGNKELDDMFGKWLDAIPKEIRQQK